MSKKFLLVHWHPEPKSMCSSIFRVGAEHLRSLGHEVKVTDLHEMTAAGKWNPTSGPHNFVEVQNKEFFKQQAEESKVAIGESKFADDVQLELEKLQWCDFLVLVFPMWWFSLPAALKNWVDRVFACGTVYGGSAGVYDKAIFGQNKRAFLVSTTGSPAQGYMPDGMNGDLHGVLRHIHRGMLQFCGFSVLEPSMCYSAAHGSDDDRRQWLETFKKRLGGIVDEKPIEVGRYA